MNILITGASGFIGKPLIDELIKEGFDCSALFHFSPVCDYKSELKNIFFREINSLTQWDDVLINIDVVIHTAAIAHKFDKINEIEVHDVNVQGVERLSKACIKNGVKQLIYLSSSNVNKVLSSDKTVGLLDRSKYAAEQVLINVSEGLLDFVIIRPPLVYGESVKGNFLTLMRLIGKGIPLPIALMRNRKSLVSLYNLIDLIKVCVGNERAKNQVFYVSDDCDISTLELVSSLKKLLYSKSLIFPVPLFLLELLGKIFGKYSMVKSLSSENVIDISHTKSTLKWSPPYSVEDSLRKTVSFQYKK